MMNIEKEKQRMLSELDAVENDMNTLKVNIEKIRKALEKVQTEDDAMTFDAEYDIEEGLEHIEIF